MRTCEVPCSGSMITFDDHTMPRYKNDFCIPVFGRFARAGLQACGEAFKLRGSPKASPTTHFSKGKLGTEGNDLKSVVKAVRMIEREMGNPHAKPLCARSVLRCVFVGYLSEAGDLGGDLFCATFSYPVIYHSFALSRS